MPHAFSAAPAFGRAFAASVACAIALAAQAEAQSNRLWVFGDSLSDNGNLYALTLRLYPPADEYFEGRFSNGPTWAERLGFSLGRAPGLLRFDPAFTSTVEGVNFAHGGASATERLLAPAFLEATSQVEFYRSGVNDGRLTVGRNDIATLWAGANDYILYGETNVNVPVDGVMRALRSIDESGVGAIVVFNLPDIGATPFAQKEGRVEELSALSIAHNQALKAALRAYRPNARLIEIDAQQIFEVVLARPGLFGFKVTGVGDAGSATGNCLGDGLLLTACPSTYLFYDSLHPTAAGHDLISRIVSAQLAFDASRAAQTALRAETSVAVAGAQRNLVFARLAAAGAAQAGPAFGLSLRGGPAAQLAPVGRLTLFSLGVGLLADQDGGLAREAREAEAGPTLAAFGGDWRAAPGLSFGAAYLAAQDAADFGNLNLLTGRSEAQGVSAYVSYVRRGFAGEVSVHAADERQDLVRATGLAELPFVSGRAQARMTAIGVGGAYTWRAGAFSFGPEARLEQARLALSSLQESGSYGLVDFAFPEAAYEGLAGRFGLRAGFAHASRPGATLGLEVGLGVIGALSGEAPYLQLAPGAELSRSAAQASFTETTTALSAGLSWTTPALSLSAEAGALTAGGEAVSAATVRGALRW